MTRMTIIATLLVAVALLQAPAESQSAVRSTGVNPTQGEGKYILPERFARRPVGVKALSLTDEDVLLATAWMEPSDATEPDARIIFDDQEEVDLFVAFLGGDTGGDVRVTLKLKGETTGGVLKDKWRDYVDDDDVVITRWWSFGVLPRGRYRMKIKVKDGTRFGQGETEMHFEVLDLD